MNTKDHVNRNPLDRYIGFDTRWKGLRRRERLRYGTIHDSRFND